MELFDVITQIFQAVFPFHKLGLNPLDLLILFVILFYAFEGYTLGFVAAIVDLISFIISFALALKFYTGLTTILVSILSMPMGIANAVSFFLIALIAEILLSLLLRRLVLYLPTIPDGEARKVFIKSNHVLGILPGIFSACIIIAFLLTIIISLPSSQFLKRVVSESRIGSRLVANTAIVEKKMNQVFGGAINETLNFLTVSPESNESIKLNFTVTDGSIDEDAEEEMLALVNKERVQAGFTPLRLDNSLTKLARNYSEDMFTRGYFSHYNPEGESPFIRMEKAGIVYMFAGENLALAPNVELAMQGLMNSTGHRKNMLSPDYTKVGIGVIDGGIYGKMFTQEFTD